jgi:hypothetical protein
VQLDKRMILDLLRQRGDQRTADQANRELPDQVDTDQHAGLLEQFGLRLDTLQERFTGGGLPNL